MLALVSSGAWAAGFGVTRLAAPRVAPPSPAASLEVASPAAAPAPAPRRARERPRRPSKRALTAAIVERSIFDPSKVGGPEPEVVPDGPTPSDLDLLLVSTLVAEPAAYSSAWIGREETKTVRKKVQRRGRKRKKRRRRTRRVKVREVVDAAGYGVGDRIRGHDATLVAIEQGRVTLRRGDGRLELLLLEPPEEEAGAPAVASRPAADDDGIERLGADHVSIDRAVLDQLTDDPSQLARLGRAVPHKGPDGDVDGYRLSGIRRRSLGRKLGLRSGDVVHAVEGHELTSMSAAMNAWTALQGADAVEVDLTRRGRKRTLKVEID